MHEELLRLARLLAADTGGYPRWITQNRAVSTAYYALFHGVAECCARDLVGARKPWDAFRHIYRSLDHGRARDEFKRLLKARDVARSVMDLAQVFIDLQIARHAADYDPGHRVSASELDDILTRAELGIALIRQIPREDRKLLAARLIGRTRA